MLKSNDFDSIQKFIDYLNKKSTLLIEECFNLSIASKGACSYESMYDLTFKERQILSKQIIALNTPAESS